jgi:hypothetical protein
MDPVIPALRPCCRPGTPERSRRPRPDFGDAATPLSRLGNDAVVTEDRRHPAVKLGANGATVCHVNLAGRATSVPFHSGHYRSRADNHG